MKIVGSQVWRLVGVKVGVAIDLWALEWAWHSAKNKLALRKKL